MDDLRRIEESSRPSDPRSPYRRDRDRVLYSGHFARLAEITQVVSPERGYVFHNRLTHSLKVAQIARTIAEVFALKHPGPCERLGGIDADAAEAAGLAHDLGHPPFGHIAEQELDRLVRRAGVPDGFEGNAQSLRIVCRLAVSDAVTLENDVAIAISGLNLTRKTLAGMIKYPWGYGANSSKPDKWGYYSEEQEYFEWARTGCRPGRKTLIAEVMDWADDITYAIHDLLDFYRAGLIPIELMHKRQDVPASVERKSFVEHMIARRPEWGNRQEECEAALDSLLAAVPFDMTHRYSGNEGDEQSLYQFATILISRYVNSIEPSSADDGSAVQIQKDARDQVDVLKAFIWRYVILNPDMAQLQLGHRRAIRLVFRESLRATRKQKDAHFFPEPFKGRLAECVNDAQRVRLAADYVAGLTERELINTYSRLQGLAHA